jgi:hypothetical protein
LLRPAAQQYSIASQSFRIRVILGAFQFLELWNRVVVRPAMLVGLGQAAPPDFIGKPECPGGVVAGQPN